MAILSPLTRTIKCLLAALLAHACMVNASSPFDEFSNFTTSSGAPTGGSFWSYFGGSATPAAAPVSSSGGSGGWLPSWFSGAGSSSSSQSSSSGQSSFSPSATQLAIGAAGAAAASLTTYYLYNLYQKFNKQYEDAKAYYQPMLSALEFYIGFDKKPTAISVPTEERNAFLNIVKEKQQSNKADLNQFRDKLLADITALSPLNWAAVGAPLYTKIVTPTKVAALKGELVDLLHYVDSLLKAEQENPAVTSSSTSASAAVQAVRQPAKTAAAAQPKALEAWEQYNKLLSEQPQRFKRTTPWSDYGQQVKEAIDTAQKYGTFQQLLNIINNYLDAADKSHAAFALFIDNLKMDTVTRSNPLITLVQTKPGILNEMPEKLKKQLLEKLSTLGVTVPQTPKQAASTRVAEVQQKQVAVQSMRRDVPLSEKTAQELSSDDWRKLLKGGA